MDLRDVQRIFEWDELVEVSSYYEVLGLLEIADAEAIRRAFHQFALAFHPDSFPEADEETTDALLRVFQCGAEAYRVLSRPELRSDYDLALARGQLRLGMGTTDVASGARSLDELCSSPGARRYAKRAEELISTGDLASAKRQLQMALREDGQNAELTERLDALDLALYAMGS